MTIYHLVGSSPIISSLYINLPDYRLVCWRCILQQRRGFGFRAVKRTITPEPNGRHNRYQDVEMRSVRMSSSRTSARIFSTVIKSRDEPMRTALAHRVAQVVGVRPPLQSRLDYKHRRSYPVGYNYLLLLRRAPTDIA